MFFFFDRNINDEQMWTGERKIGMGGMRETKSRKLKQNSNKNEKKFGNGIFLDDRSICRECKYKVHFLTNLYIKL